jgi:hypothetical protein
MTEKKDERMRKYRRLLVNIEILNSKDGVYSRLSKAEIAISIKPNNKPTDNNSGDNNNKQFLSRFWSDGRKVENGEMAIRGIFSIQFEIKGAEYIRKGGNQKEKNRK